MKMPPRIRKRLAKLLCFHETISTKDLIDSLREIANYLEALQSFEP
jgi:hypothetical protein